MGLKRPKSLDLLTDLLSSVNSIVRDMMENNSMKFNI